MPPGEPSAPGRPVRVARCALRLSREPWAFADDRRAQIAAHWAQASAGRPKLFDGTVFMLRRWSFADDVFAGEFVRTDFKSFLYWRDNGFADAGVRDGFGSALIRSSEGHVLLGRQTSGNVNAGLAYPPGGFIDARDVHDGTIDIDASIARELAEETGLAADALARVPGYVVAPTGPSVSIAIEWRSTLSADRLRARILEHVGSQPAPELADVVIVRARSEIDEDCMPPHAKALLGLLLPA